MHRAVVDTDRKADDEAAGACPQITVDDGIARAGDAHPAEDAIVRGGTQVHWQGGRSTRVRSQRVYQQPQQQYEAGQRSEDDCGRGLASRLNVHFFALLFPKRREIHPRLLDPTGLKSLSG
jgi:hypothetical protein